MISDNAFAQEVREVTDTAFAVSYLILGNSTDCEDAVGQAVLQAYESRGKLRKRESFRAWFLKILRNEAYGILRRQRRVQPVDELPEQSAPQEDTDERLDLQSMRISARRCFCSRRDTPWRKSHRRWTRRWGPSNPASIGRRAH